MARAILPDVQLAASKRELKSRIILFIVLSCYAAKLNTTEFPLFLILRSHLIIRPP